MYQYPDYLMHYGVLGMKWGRRRERRAAKKEAKAIRRKAYSEAYAADSSRRKAADEQFSKSMSSRDMALKKNKSEYKSKAKSISDYYDSNIDYHNKRAALAKDEIDFFNGNEFMTRDARKSLEKHTRKAKEYSSAKDSALMKNSSEFMEAERKIISDYAGIYDKATVAKKEAYAKSGQQLTKDLGVANKAYKEAVKRNK